MERPAFRMSGERKRNRFRCYCIFPRLLRFVSSSRGSVEKASLERAATLERGDRAPARRKRQAPISPGSRRAATRQTWCEFSISSPNEGIHGAILASTRNGLAILNQRFDGAIQTSTYYTQILITKLTKRASRYRPQHDGKAARRRVLAGWT